MRSSTQMNTQAISKLENQVGQLATHVGEREKGKFPSQPVPNPKGQYGINNSSSSTHDQEHVQSITILRSGRQIDNQVKTPEFEKTDTSESSQDDHRHDKEKENLTPISIHVPVQDPSSSQPIAANRTVKNFVPKAPFPQRLARANKGAQYGDILEIFKQVHINIPFLDAIQQVPTYAKFLKDMVAVKRKTNVPKKAFLTEHASSILQCKYPIKYKDPGCPTISCKIGDHDVEQALLDLGASVNLLQYSVYVQLGLGELKPTKMTLQLADRSVKIPRGIVEDVLIKVDAFYFPVDFVVLDTEPMQNGSGQIYVILGRSFLATANALINCRNGVMKISFGNMTVELNIFDISKQAPENEEVNEVYMVESLGHDTFI